MEKPSREEVSQKIRQEQVRSLDVISKREKTPETAFWLSFVGEEGFRGVCIVHAEDFIVALMEANLRKLNPGGEVQGMGLDADCAKKIPVRYKNRLLSKLDCQALEKEMEKNYGQVVKNES